MADARPFSAEGRRANLADLAETELDLLVIGGGITGAGVALQAIQSGYRVGLVEARDFASGPPTRNKKGPKAGRVEGDTVDHSGGDIETTAEGRGAAAVSRGPRPDPDEMDDSFAGEVSQDEASGQDSR